MKRRIFNELIKWKNFNPRKPLVLKGARQVGKTWILKEFGTKEFNNYFYINFEDETELHLIFNKNLHPQRIVKEISFHFDRDINVETDLLIFDEIQKCPQALTSLKYFCEELSELAICSAGSLLGLFHGTSSFPVGKVTFLELFPLDFMEYCQAIDKTMIAREMESLDPHKDSEVSAIVHEKIWEIWKEYVITGGMPEIVDKLIMLKERNVTTFKILRKMQYDLINAHTADIAKNSGRMKSLNIERLWLNIPKQLTETIDTSVKKFRFKDAVPGLRGFDQLTGSLDWLEKAGLILKTSIVNNAQIPLSAFIKENKFKLYFFDTGLLGAISNLSPASLFKMEFGSFKGYIAENFTAQELRTNFQQNLFCWTGRTSEIEFLLQIEDEVFPVEVKSGFVTKSKSLKAYYDKYSPKKGVILSARNEFRFTNNGILRAPIYLAGQIYKFF